MTTPPSLATQPLFLLFIGLSFLLAVGYLWGRRKNRELCISSLRDLAGVLQPVDETYTNIGGSIGYHATLVAGKKSFLKDAEITILLLPRQAWLYFPISYLIRRWDRLFITLNLKGHPPAEGHLIEARYARFGPRITNAPRMKQEQVRWGNKRFVLYSTNDNTRRHLSGLMDRMDSPGNLKHIALVPQQKRCFVLMVPRKRQVAAQFAPVFEWLPTTLHSG